MKKIFLGNDWDLKWRGTTDNPLTGEAEAATGLTTLVGWLSASDEGPPINGDLRKPMIERPGRPGSYKATIDGDALAVHLGEYIGLVVYEVFGDEGVNVVYSSPRRVMRSRRP